MNGFENDYGAMTLQRAREIEIRRKIENAQNVRSLREKAEQHVRRAIRINNNPPR